METPKSENPVKLKRYQVYNGLELALDTARINTAQKKVDELKQEATDEITFIDTKDKETIVHTKDRYSKNYRVRKTKK